MKLRPEQIDVLKYRGGRMAISAVPGSGKTFTLSLLAAELLANQRIQIENGQNILIVTYLNSSVDNFRSRIRQKLDDLGIPPVGFDVRTLHSLALEIVRLEYGGAIEVDDLPTVIEENQVAKFFERAVDGWIESNTDLWQKFLIDDSPRFRIRWRETTERMAKAFVKTAKNQRLSPEAIWQKITSSTIYSQGHSDFELPPIEQESLHSIDGKLLLMLTGIYQRYQLILDNLASYDFDDLIWQAVNLLEGRFDLNQELRGRWPFILEDEAQDSLPLQELLLDSLTGKGGNWVRVGDPNQAITSTFTAADPKYFIDFINLPDVVSLPLDVSGRCAPLIFGSANDLVHWVCDSHPIPEVRLHAFRRQDIRPTPPGDAQANPPDKESSLNINVYRHREEEELPSVAAKAQRYAEDNPKHTLAILVPTNEVGHNLALELDSLGAQYDNLLRGSKRVQDIAAVLQAILSLLAEPMKGQNLISVYSWLHEIEHPSVFSGQAKPERVETLLRSLYRPESFLFPSEDEEFAASLPAGVVARDELLALESFRSLLLELFQLRPLPVEDLILTIAEMLFHHQLSEEEGRTESDLASAYQIANVVRQWRDLQPEWRLPELAEQLNEIAHGRRHMRNVGADFGYNPEPGRISLSTQHSAKGKEWDAVFLVGIDSMWIPGDLEANFLGTSDFMNGDPIAESRAALLRLMEIESGVYPGRSATDSAHIDIICERLRLLYVGITRARRVLYISRSRQTRRYKKDYDAPAASAMKVIYESTRDYIY